MKRKNCYLQLLAFKHLVLLDPQCSFRLSLQEKKKTSLQDMVNHSDWMITLYKGEWK